MQIPRAMIFTLMWTTKPKFWEIFKTSLDAKSIFLLAKHMSKKRIFKGTAIIKWQWWKRKSLNFKSIWLHVKCLTKLEFPVFNFFFFLVWVFTITSWPIQGKKKKKLKTDRLISILHFTCNQKDLQKNSLLSHPALPLWEQNEGKMRGNYPKKEE